MSNIIDTLLDDEDNALLSNASNIKRHIYSYIDTTKLLQFIVDSIDNSDIIKFERESDKRFLNLFQLQLFLMMDIPAKSKLLQKSNNSDKQKTIDVRSEFINEVVILPFINLLTELFQKITFNKEPVEYSELIDELLTEDVEVLRHKINSIVELSDEEKEKLHKEFNFAFGLIHAITFPPDEVTDIDIDTGFTLEIMI
jgi:hypothetical protein